MPSHKPRDFGQSVVNRWHCSPVHRSVLALGQFSANTTKIGGSVPFDRKGVIREIWVSSSAIPSDADGTLLLDADVYDASEAAADSIVQAQNLETVCAVANKAYELTLVAESGGENQYTVFPGDSLYFTLTSNSAAIDTNPYVSVVVVWQALVDVAD